VNDKNLHDFRQNYQKSELSLESAGDDPVKLFVEWLNCAIEQNEQEPNAMTVSTIATDHSPRSRIVLLKEISKGGFVFFTNYNSDKAEEIATNPNVSLNFLWKNMEQQIRVVGKAEKLTVAENEIYFSKRPDASKIGAWASHQSETLASYDELMDRFKTYQKRYAESEVPCPPNWGGYRIIPNRVEFWQGRPNRLHDRILFVKDGEQWQRQRLNP